MYFSIAAWSSFSVICLLTLSNLVSKASAIFTFSFSTFFSALICLMLIPLLILLLLKPLLGFCSKELFSSSVNLVCGSSFAVAEVFALDCVF